MALPAPEMSVPRTLPNLSPTTYSESPRTHCMSARKPSKSSGDTMTEMLSRALDQRFANARGQDNASPYGCASSDDGFLSDSDVETPRKSIPMRYANNKQRCCTCRAGGWPEQPGL